MARETKAEQQAADQKLITSLPLYLTTPLTVSGKSYTAAQLVTVLQGRVQARTSVDTAKGAYQNALAAEETTLAASKALVAGAKQVLLVMFAGAADTLAAMGLQARKTTTPDVATKSAAIEKSRATRTARHTMGPKAKAKITGATAATAVTVPATTTPAVTSHS